MNDTELNERRQRCGASDAAAILGLSPFSTPYETWLEKTGRIEPSKGNDATRMGQRLERTILDVAESELGELTRGEVLFAPGLDFPLASTLDARVKSSGVPVEAKSSGIVGPVYGEWGEESSDVVPPYYLVQLSIQMLCAEAELAHLFALLGGRGIVRYQAVRDAQLTTEIVERLSRWWQRHIVEDAEPTRIEPVPLEVVKRLRRQPQKTIELYAEDMQTVAEYENAKSLKSSAEKSFEAAQAKLLLLLGDAEGARLADGRVLTYLEQTRKGYTVLDSTYRVMRIKKG